MYPLVRIRTFWYESHTSIKTWFVAVLTFYIKASTLLLTFYCHSIRWQPSHHFSMIILNIVTNLSKFKASPRDLPCLSAWPLLAHQHVNCSSKFIFALMFATACLHLVAYKYSWKNLQNCDIKICCVLKAFLYFILLISHSIPRAPFCFS